MNKNKIKEFNIVIVGTGGQGLITLLQILAQAAVIENYDVRTSELHGLSQRGGSVEVHLRFGRKVYSPLVAQAGADLILALEAQEILKSSYFFNSQTTLLINKFFIPILNEKQLSETIISKELKKITKSIIFISAVDICEKELDSKVVAGVYLLSYACFKNMIPLNPNSVLKAIEKIVKKKYLELNKKTFKLAEKYAKD